MATAIPMRHRSPATYFINQEGTATGAGSLRDPFVRVHDLNGTQLEFNDDGGEGYNSFIAFTPQASGDFFIAAGGFNDGVTGTYRLSLTTARSKR
jgi:serralysin